MTNGPIELARSLAARLPAADMRALSDAAIAGPTGIQEMRTKASSNLIRKACDDLLDCIMGGCSSHFLAGSLAAAAAANSDARRHQHIDVVWTGPDSGVRTNRLTAAAIVALIDEAVDEIVLVSYATFSEAGVTRALQAAANRGVDIILLMERNADNPRYSYRGSDPFPNLNALRLTWPASQRHPGASMHAKIVVVDANTALVGSANISNNAMEINLECGILIRGGGQPRAIRDHILSLRELGRITPA